MLEQIKEIVAESLNVEADTLTTDTSFKEKLKYRVKIWKKSKRSETWFLM